MTTPDPSERHVRRIPGEPGVWILIAGDAAIFSLLFVLFLVARSRNIELFQASQGHLNQTFGVLNTLLLLVSSWLVVSAVHAARQNLANLTARLLLSAIACAGGFCVSKGIEWSDKIRSGFTITTDDFFMYYYVLTGIHLGHLLLGMAVLAFLTFQTRSGRIGEREMRNLESGASFWHLVDLLWITLFALLYLAR